MATFKKEITPELLAKFIFEELEADGWGDIEPYLFRSVAENDFVLESCYENEDESSEDENALALKEVLERVCERLNED